MSESLYIGGRWRAGKAEVLTSEDPSTGEQIWKGTTADEDDVAAAVAAARRAFEAWRRRPIHERFEAVREFRDEVRRRSDEVADVIARETGKPLWETATEAASLAAKVDISIEAYRDRTSIRTSEMGSGRSVVRHRPHGVFAVFGPYNFPMHLPNGHIVPAIIAGNAIVFKPSEMTPWSAELYTHLWEGAGLPAGVLNLVQGGRDTGASLAGHHDVNGILFTGSARTGKLIHAQLGGRPDVLLALEMGGNNPLIITEVEDLPAAVYHTVQSAYLSSGQRCTCARRLLVPDGPWGDEFLRELQRAVTSIVVGPPTADPQPFMGPLVSPRAADDLLEAQQTLLDLGATALVPMERLTLGPGFASPGLIDVTGVAGVPDEEYFGPLLTLERYVDLDDAIDRANNTRFGLSAGIFTDDVAEYEQFLEESTAGIINLNRPLTGASSSAPFGGTGDSGNHRPAAYTAADYVAYPVASLEMDELDIPEHRPPGLG